MEISNLINFHNHVLKLLKYYNINIIFKQEIS